MDGYIEYKSVHDVTKGDRVVVCPRGAVTLDTVCHDAVVLNVDTAKVNYMTKTGRYVMASEIFLKVFVKDTSMAFFSMKEKM